MAAALFRQARTRNPLLRALSALLGVLIVGATLVFGFFVLVALAAIGAAVWAARQFGKSAERPAAGTATPPPASPPPGVIEGEFVVVREPAPRR
ncbi:hypothetical protein [Tahibacter harae]|uniref:Uncharacterized protein n=1 Tax=Tahibacter harae TaxID=2963937 RepID=A0ABT1QUZ1_9GAMM|nr:hypothetical protein [Tahibacter harae]MCQ4166105.1 hypothetical protein [Tahibacter harae]